MKSPANPAPDLAGELALSRAQCETLAAENTRLALINETLMDRVERDMDRQGNSFSLFQAAIALESTVNERTAALQQAMQALEQSNRELQELSDAAQTANRAKSAFLATMSHELRTPMNGVVGMAELLLQSTLDAKQRRSAEIIRSSALSLLGILNEVLDFSKIEADRLTTESVPFDLIAITNNTLLLLEPQAASKQLTLERDWQDELPRTVVGDPTRYAQIITNLVGNAIKFTARGGVTIRIRLQSELEGSAIYRFEIADTGIGIRRDVIPRLFEAFTQSDNSITRQYGGTGLGLAIVRRLCQLMGGECGVESELGAGSVFWFTLTLQRGDHTTELSAPAMETILTTRLPATIRGGPVRVLLAEDNQVNQEVTRGLLEFLRCHCTIVANGVLAVQALTVPHNFDLVLMDCQMPQMDGYEATRRIRHYEQSQGQRVPIVALTANAMMGDREACLTAGMDDFLSKPFQLPELKRILERWCPADPSVWPDANHHELRARDLA